MTARYFSKVVLYLFSKNGKCSLCLIRKHILFKVLIFLCFALGRSLKCLLALVYSFDPRRFFTGLCDYQG